MRKTFVDKNFYLTSEGQPIMDGGSNGKGLEWLTSTAEGYPIMDGSEATEKQAVEYFIVGGGRNTAIGLQHESNFNTQLEESSVLPKNAENAVQSPDIKVEEPDDKDVFFTINGRLVVDKSGLGGLNKGIWEKNVEGRRCPQNWEALERKNKGLVPGSQSWLAVEEIHYRMTSGAFGKPGSYERRGPYQGKHWLEFPSKLKNETSTRIAFIRDGTIGMQYEIVEKLKDEDEEPGYNIVAGQPGAQAAPSKSIKRVENVEQVEYRVLDEISQDRGMYQMSLHNIAAARFIRA